MMRAGKDYIAKAAKAGKARRSHAVKNETSSKLMDEVSSMMKPAKRPRKRGK